MNTMMRYAAMEARRRDGKGRFTSEAEEGMRSEANGRTRYESNEMRRGGTRYEANRYEPRMEERYESGRMEERRVEPGRDESPRGDGTFRMTYDGGEARRMIGFGNAEAHYKGPMKGDEFEHRKSHRDRGYSASTVYMPITEALAEEWVHHMRNADGSTGPRWTREETDELMRKKGMDCDPLIFWVCMNAEYSDRCEVYKKYGVDSLNFYADCVKAFWMNDDDAVDDKAAAYYACVVKH